MHQAKGAPSPFAQRYRMREVERQLTQDIQIASERVRLFQGTPEDKEMVVRAYEGSLHRFAEFAAKGIVPDDLKNIPIRITSGV
jgi:hypothetical protein